MSDPENEPMEGPAWDALALSARPVEPPPELRGRVLAVARRRPTLMRLPLAAVAAVAVVALLAGALIGNALRTPNPPPTAQVTYFTLAGHGTYLNVNGDVTYVKGQLAVVQFADLPELQPSKVYELWLITPGQHVDAAGVFTPDHNGDAQVVVKRSLASYAVIAVTVEQGPDGASAPTQQPVISGTIPA
jgi:anti-sigma-K factor RskA